MTQHLPIASRYCLAPARWFAASVIACALLVGAPANAQQRYKTPDEAVEALVSAARGGDDKAILAVLGRGGADIVSSGDPVADATMRKTFLQAYDAKHRVALEGEDKAALVIGTDDWPFPIPLDRAYGKWAFNTAAGREEILVRRIGRNELAAIQAARAYVDAQYDYASKDRGAGAGVYAQSIVSQPGKQDGLYWPSARGDDPSPIGDLVAMATRQGYLIGGERTPFHGYYFKILTRQGAAAPGGAVNYVARGKMIGGFALVAYPAEYGNSGVMTFLVNHNGDVFQKDLGPRTGRLAEGMTSFNPDHTWRKVDLGVAAR